MLNAMRWGRLNNDMVSRFRQLAREVTYTDGIEPTELYPTRNEVETSNNSRLDQINSEAVPYLAWDRPGVSASGRPTSDREMERLLERLIALKMVVLKVGAQVMLVKNLKQGQLVNGSLGKVIRFSTYKDAARRHTQTLPNGANENEISTFVRQSPMFWPVVKFTNGVERLCVPEEFTVNNASGEVEASRHQYPQVPGTDAGASQGGSSQHLRERTGLCSALPCDKYGNVGSSEF
ncbi:hypothetical protein BC834DRAFT_17333 [Gloeopeniophorella convolvens]|nr:hypothetical protein BC834DRAFT_17333 [Gloeopeniophorella convolvens]